MSVNTHIKSSNWCNSVLKMTRASPLMKKEDSHADYWISVKSCCFNTFEKSYYLGWHKFLALQFTYLSVNAQSAFEKKKQTNQKNVPATDFKIIPVLLCFSI